MLITIPLMWYLRSQSCDKRIRIGLLVLIALTMVATIGTHSRGALLGLTAMGAMLWWKSKQKFSIAILLSIVIVLIFILMPSEWFERMNTIKTYEEDQSAMGRINAWSMAINLASERIFGGGFETASAATFRMYAPDPLAVHDFHSIYFEILGEHGFIGLGLYILLYVFTWLRLGKIIKLSKKESDFKWAGELSAMIQVSLVGFAVAGTFLGLAYFDLPYHLMAISVITFNMLNANQGNGKRDYHKNKAFI